MFLEKLHFYIALFAGAVMTAVNIYLQASLLDVSIRLIITLTLFYVIGYFTQRYIRKKILKLYEPEVHDEPEGEGSIVEKEPTLMYDDSFPGNTITTSDDLPQEDITLPNEDES